MHNHASDTPTNLIMIITNLKIKKSSSSKCFQKYIYYIVFGYVMCPYYIDKGTDNSYKMYCVLIECTLDYF